MLSMTAETASDYIGLKTAQEQLRITKENLRLQQDIYQTVKEKYDNGLADDAALNQAEFAVQTTKALLPALEQQEESYKNALAVLLGVLPGSLTGLDDDGDNLIGRPFFFHVENLYNFPLAAVAQPSRRADGGKCADCQKRGDRIRRWRNCFRT